ncbi:FecR family protein [Ferruginibacter sp.]
MPEAKLQDLFAKHVAKTITEAEKQELAMLLLSPQWEGKVKELLQQSWEEEHGDEMMPIHKREALLHAILSAEAPVAATETVKSYSIWKRVAAAAAVLLLVSVGGYMLLKNKPAQWESIAEVPAKKTPVTDISAPAARAMITLADGRVLPLDSINNGTFATQGGVNLVKNANGQIVYSAAQKATGDIQYNTLTNPRGSKVVDMILADGSRVWLNAGSSLTYPVAFAGKERKVAITGEAYFEVVHNDAMPFKVSYGQTEITDLGTEFNVNAYENEANVKVTLLQGSVKVTQPVAGINKGIIIKPGEQAQVKNDIKVIKDVDVEKVMAWKNGVFNFQDASLEDVMRQLERWYNIEVVYEKGVPQFEFVGKLSRTLSLSAVLHGLEVSKVHFRLEQGKRVVVLP